MITDSGTLAGMAKAGFIEYPIDKGHKYVDCTPSVEMGGFKYKGKAYVVDYVPGCFYPFVFARKQPNENHTLKEN